MKNNKFHLVKESNFPIMSSIASNVTLMSLPKMFKTMNMKLFNLFMILTMYLIMTWSFKVKEENMMGLHSKKNINILKSSFVLFILSEVLLFISLFWMYLNNSLSPNFETGNMWPPKMIELANPSLMPMYGTILLIYSGVLITWSHHMLNKKNNFNCLNKLNKCIIMGLLFLDMQISEYSFSNMIFFSINDSNYSNSFFFITGIHGSHVLAGVLMLLSTKLFMKNKSVSFSNHSSFEISAWYWHFVDLIWLFVFSLIYWMNF